MLLHLPSMAWAASKRRLRWRMRRVVVAAGVESESGHGHVPMGLTPEHSTCKVHPTIDVTAPLPTGTGVARRWCRWKGRVHGRIGRLAERWRVLVRRQHDPYDTYDGLNPCTRRTVKRASFCLPTGDHTTHRFIGGNWPYALVQRLLQSASVGIHPGTRATIRQIPHDSKGSQPLEELSKAPVNTLDNILLQRFPSTWRRLEAAGIQHDHSMGYADHIGFRAGMSRPYKAYDVAANRPLDLTIHPTAAMDATLNRYMGLSPGQALDALEQLAGEVKLDGELTLWHNETVVNATNGRGGVRCTNKYLNAFVKAETMVTDFLKPTV